MTVINGKIIKIGDVILSDHVTDVVIFPNREFRNDEVRKAVELAGDGEMLYGVSFRENLNAHKKEQYLAELDSTGMARPRLSEIAYKERANP